ncbi:hypothetical protein F7P10_03755 [Actinomadura sp. WMMB 499]|nr:hypothetical protein F7P10_03755 [Actinomadura sp. WMMB 499]
MWTFAGRDTAIDLGSATVRMHVEKNGVVCREPSLLARSRQTGRILALGTPAREMAGRTPTSPSCARSGKGRRRRPTRPNG